MEATIAEKRKSLRKMLQEPQCHIAPSCNDGIQARLVEWLGFPLVHISGSGQHRSLGFADAGLLTLTEMIDKARQIVDAVNLPVVSDAETGYGNPVNVVRTVREFERAGVAAIHIEDQMTPKRAGHEGFDVGLVSREEFVAKIKAALDTRKDENLIIIARSEAKDSLPERIERVQACCEAGADAVWVSARSEDDIKAFAKIGKPMVGVPPRQLMTIQRYGELGGRVGCIPTVLQVAALHGMRQCLEELKRSGTETRYFKETPGIDETRKWYSELGNKELKELEAKYRY
ncbi:MAG TPA: isocitrate lyase/PEP mutase family protein [Candidatus Acidoferrales bacterium]|nr:isocitrate lyase/PEP mutase family protein [Candidatus Acidoferrales bacterium]